MGTKISLPGYSSIRKDSLQALSDEPTDRKGFIRSPTITLDNLEGAMRLTNENVFLAFCLLATNHLACNNSSWPSQQESQAKCKTLVSMSLSGEGTWETGGHPVPSPSALTVTTSGRDCIVESAATAADASKSAAADIRAMESASGAASPTSVSWTTGGGSNQKIGPGILTAGSFDDSLNLDVFKKYWMSPVQGEILSWDRKGTPSIPLPKIDDLKLPGRFQNQTFTALDLSLIIDTTGSMGDELAYIKAEISNISSSIKAKYPNVRQRFSLIVYRDEGDQYITRGIEFTEDLTLFQKFLDSQSADGGGDYPEALHLALAEADSKLQWGDASVAKVAFLIADAPAHDQYLNSSFDTIQKLRDKGVRLFPVAASGVADLAERMMRFGALITGGEYLFLTDDSKVGNAHAEPHIPCYHVRKLNELMIDTVSSELEQKRLEPAADRILRTVGAPQAGVCIK